MLRFAVATLVLVTLVVEAPAAGQGQDCLARGRYFGESLPGETPEIFAPGIASTQHHDDGVPVFSSEGREVILRVNGKVSGEIIGVFFWSEMDETGCWSEPVPLPFSGRYPDGGLAYSPDESRLYMSTKRPALGESQISERSRAWYVDREGRDWAEPTRAGVWISSTTSPSRRMPIATGSAPRSSPC